MKFTMDDAEIRTSYNTAKNRETQVRVLAERSWISVKERLPNEKQRVIVRCNTVGTTVGWRLWGEWVTDLGDGGSEVTHWMPLPEPPEKEA